MRVSLPPLRRGFLSLVFLTVGWSTGCERVENRVLVSAAVSLTEALEEVGKNYEERHGELVVFNVGPSNALSRQIVEGAPVDLFISADEAQMDRVERAGLLIPGSRVTLLTNRLAVVVSSKANITLQTPADLASERIGKIAIGDPTAVPAGVYARKYLESLGLWSSLQTKLIPTSSVRGALTAVETGAADAGIVYRTDAAISGDVRIAFEVPPSADLQITYPSATIQTGRNPDGGRRFLAHLREQQSKEVFRRRGFVVN